MKSEPSRRDKLDWIQAVCWIVIAAYAADKLVRLLQGEPLSVVFDFSTPSWLGVSAAVGAFVLAFRSPRILKSATMIEASEFKSVLLSFSFVFILMAAYYILRPVRDAMASDWSNTEISVLWNIQLVLSTLLIAGYGFACSRIKFTRLVPAVYIFFAVTFVAFYFAASAVGDGVLIDKAFYIWVTLFSLMHLSVFWTFMADVFTKEQSKRLFAFIAAGASAGAAAGPLFAGLIVSDIGTDNLILVASAMLLIPIPMVPYLQRLKQSELHNEHVHADLSAARIGGNPLAGFKYFFSNPYLLMIGAFILFYTSIGSFVYFEQVEVLRDFTREERTAILATLAAVVNILTFGLGIFATSRIISKLGMAATLALVPFFVCAGLLILAFAPIINVLLALQIARQGGNYGITRPAREMLYTNVDRETRFKSKPVVDVVVYRGGDAASSIVFAWLTDGIGFGVAAMAAIGAMIAAVWGGVGIYLGRCFNRARVDEPARQPDASGVIGVSPAASSQRN